MSVFKSMRERGQATLEVILLAFIAVVVILGLIYRFNTAFKKYTTDLYGNYYRCLLETGELPGTGSVCKDRAARFDIAAGREKLKWQPIDDGGSGGSGGAGGGSGGAGGGGSKGPNGDKSGDGAGKDSGNSGGSSSPSASSGGDSVAAGGAASGSGQSVVGKLKQISKRNSSTAVAGADRLSDDEKNLAGNGDSLKADYAGARANTDALKAARTRMDYALSAEERGGESKLAAAQAVGSVSKRAESNGDALRPRKAVENTDRKPAQAGLKEDSSGMDFGKIFRIFMIIAIIVAIIIFIGGQILQISKSSER